MTQINLIKLYYFAKFNNSKNFFISRTVFKVTKLKMTSFKARIDNIFSLLQQNPLLVLIYINTLFPLLFIVSNLI